MTTTEQNHFLELLVVAIVGLLVCAGCGKRRGAEMGERKTSQIASGASSDEKKGDDKTDPVPLKVSDDSIIKDIEKLASSDCNAGVFQKQDAELMVLLHEWNKVEESVIELYKKSFPNRPRPQGTFITSSPRAEPRFHGFYSHNKHFELLVATALMGDTRTHVKLEQTMGAFPYFIKNLKTGFYLSGTTSPDYEKIGRLIDSAFAKNGWGKRNEVTANNDDEQCVVSSQWGPLQTIDGREYQMRIVHEVFESSGLTVFPGRYFNGDHSRLQLATYIQVQASGETTESVSSSANFGPIAGTLVSTGNQINLETETNSWMVVKVPEDKKPRADNLLTKTFESKPDLMYFRMVAVSRGNCLEYERINEMQQEIASEVQNE